MEILMLSVLSFKRVFVLACAGLCFATSARAQGFDIQVPILGNLVATTQANFLPQVRQMIEVSRTGDLAAMTKQGARIALQIEEMQINFLMTQCRKASTGRYAQEIALGCELLNAQSQLNVIKQRALGMISN
jgi:hypothetical protein